MQQQNGKNSKKPQLPVIKGNPLFKIIPEGDYEVNDDFAAIGGA
jgi:hypothetical protein